MSLQVKVRNVGSVDVVDLGGLLRMGAESTELHKEIRQLIADGKKRIVLNCAGLEYIDSFGVGELVAAFSAVKKSDGSLKLAHLTDFLKDVLRATRLLTVLEVYDTEEEAIASFDD